MARAKWMRWRVIRPSNNGPDHSGNANLLAREPPCRMLCFDQSWDPPKNPSPEPMLGTDFFQRDVITVARDLIGVELVWRGCSGIIVETEAYGVENDEASHVASRPSARAF